MIQLPELIKLSRSRVIAAINRYINQSSFKNVSVHAAMRYSIENGGKRLRPLLVYATGLALEADLNLLDAPASAVELIHTYSLIHDDLPSMDDADTRRGQPSCHQKFDEATAILAGDALQCMAFNVISQPNYTLDASKKILMINKLSEASGIDGMIGGQALDISVQNPSEEMLLHLYKHKTGVLISTSALLGAITSPNYDQITEEMILKYSHNLGLAFQIQDDILDIEGEAHKIGKPKGIDAQNHKLTIPHLIGLGQAKKLVTDLTEAAIAFLLPLGNKKLVLESLALSLVNRTH